MGISLKKITEMIVAQTLQGDEHLFLQIGAAFQEVPLPILAAAITRTVGFPKSADDLSAEYAAALEEDADLTPKEFLLTLPAGNYLLPVQLGDDEVETYQLTAMQGSDGNTTRVIMTSGAETSIELFSTAYSESDPLFAVDGESGDLLLKGNPVATRAEITQSLVGLGVPIVKESAASAELARNTYAASGDNFPTVIPADQTPDHRPVGKGSQIVFIPEHNNTGTDPTLTLNNGVAVPIRQRAAIDTQTADNTVQIAKNTLIQGMPYTLTFCGVAWLIDSYLPGEGSETTAKVTSVNGKTGRVNITADGIGAALKSYNWQSAKRGFDIYLENVEEITPEDYMWLLGQGLFYLRADDGQHFMIRSDMGAMVEAVEGEEGEEGTPAHRAGPSVRAYLFIPLEEDEESTISGGVWMGETKIISINSLEDLTSLSFLINDSKIVTEQALLTRLSGYVSNAALLQTLQGYAQKSYVTNAISNALSKFYNATIGESNYTDILGALQAGGIVYAYYDGEIFFAYEPDPRGSALIEFVSESRVIACGLGLPSGTKWFAPVQRNLETANNKVTSLSSESTDTQYPSAQAVYTAIKSLSDQTLWKDVTDEWLEFRDDNSAASFETAVRNFVDVEASAATVHGDKYRFTDSDHGTISFIVLRSTTESSTVYKLIWFAKNNPQGSPSFEYWANSRRMFGTIWDGSTLRLAVDNRYVAYKSEVDAEFGKRPLKSYVDELVRTETSEAKLSILEQSEMSTVSTRLEKYRKDGITHIKINFLNSGFLADLIRNGHDVSVHFLFCSRREGRGQHWWHPTNYDVEPSGDMPFRLGYGQLAGKAKDPYYPDILFPDVPIWMPNDGWMETEIPVTLYDANLGFMLINPTTYFLPLIKPTVVKQNGDWKSDICFISTQVPNERRKEMPVLCTWTIAIDGNEIGRPLDVLHIGCTRHRYPYHRTTVITNAPVPRIDNLYTSIQ